jgi:prepilin peptidase CpaA
MTTATLAAPIAMLVFACAMIHAGVTDLTGYKIRNSVIVLLLVAYSALAPLVGFAAPQIGWSIVVAAAVLLAAFAMFAAGLIGGGDAKLAAVTALWVGNDHTLAYLICTALLGGALALVILLFRMIPLPARLESGGWIARLHARGGGMPYGVAMAAAALIVFPATHWMAMIV